MGKLKNPRPPGHCSFCGKDRRRVQKLIAGPGVFICNECVTLCNEVLAEDIGPPASGSAPGTWASKTNRGGGRHGFRAWLHRLFVVGRPGYPASSSSSTSLS
jgi:hypothetical protein